MSEETLNYSRHAAPGPKWPNQPPKKKGFNKLLLLIPVAVVALLLLLGGVGYAAYCFVTSNKAEKEMASQPVTISTSEGLRMLNGLELSLSGIQDIERRVAHDGTSDEEEMFTRRVIALKHIYTEGFLVDHHRLQSLNSVYMLHATEFSEQQVAVLKWFFGLPPAHRQKWEYVQGPVENFVDFRQKMEAEIANRNQNN
ncbi:MAG: hypothetical protein IJT53_02705 [Prevotella sp.]|nr:hypothetical protein [Prevotella sp.]